MPSKNGAKMYIASPEARGKAIAVASEPSGAISCASATVDGFWAAAAVLHINTAQVKAMLAVNGPMSCIRRAKGIAIKPIPQATPVINMVVLAPKLSTRNPPMGAPTNPLRPAAESKLPAPTAPPGRTDAAIIGIDAIFAAYPNLAPASNKERALHLESFSKSNHLTLLFSCTLLFDSYVFLSTVSGKKLYKIRADNAAAVTQRKAALGPYSSTINPPAGAPMEIPKAREACWAASILPLSSGTVFAKSARIPLSPLSLMHLPAPNPNLAKTSGAMDCESAVSKSDAAIRAIPHIIAGFLALSANSPHGLARSRSARAGAEITIPFAADDSPISFPYSGKVGITAPTPMKSINWENKSRAKGSAVSLGKSSPKNELVTFTILVVSTA
mmetsp:Transcript_22440/g.51413  ORF Transcript_22440/g.51413 Transcript_22440/m.51413 type:complete len:387 (+) Transcript_22440:370-1530(+)